MSLIDWRSEFEIGIASIDHEHRELIELINSLHGELENNPEPEHVESFLGEIFAQISAHFALEEKMMRDIRYTEFEDHKDDHEILLDDLRDIMDEVGEGTVAGYESKLAENLRDWFGDHFKNKDAKLHLTVGA